MPTGVYVRTKQYRRVPSDPAVRIMKLVSKCHDTGCWNFTGAIDPQGYGKTAFWDGTQWKNMFSHRLAYQLFRGPIPVGLTLDHLCRNTRCCNPDHLEPVTNAENIRRAAALITHCPRSHEYTPENTGRTRLGARYCRECNRLNANKVYWAYGKEERQRRWKQRREIRARAGRQSL